MAPEIQLLLLLLLLMMSPGNSDKPGRWDELQAKEIRPITPGFRGYEVQSEEEQRLEGETFSVSCSYNPQHENGWMNWCKKTSNGESCWITRLLANSKFSLLGKDYFSSFDSKRNIFTITMYELKINDSGVYECKIFRLPKGKQVILRRFYLVVSPVQTQSPIKGLQATSETTTNISVTNRVAILSFVLVFYGLILMKGLVFLALLIVLWKWYSQSKKTLKEQERWKE
ncbi:natural cytotoxicity triggering receptor 2-like isoform X2 [Macrotis lagotis]|uniref:natural cytotoxicity triggering receptor 2-like isoform X2 n=1 Tax=Macrotis lagotis TaxID=92651 RepID=UPI003D683466